MKAAPALLVACACALVVSGSAAAKTSDDFSGHHRQVFRVVVVKGLTLGDLPKRVSELDSSREIVAHCKMGGRSAKAVAFLKQAGFTKVSNLTGGITAWAERIDNKMPKY